MPDANSILYIAEVDFPEADLAPFLEWYAWRHSADLFRAGFKSCASYGAVEGGMNVFDIYDMDDLAPFDSAAYREMATRDPYDAHVMVGAIKEAATIYRQHVLWSPLKSNAIPCLDASWLSVIRFEADPPSEDRIVDWLGDVHGPRLGALGAKGLRFATRCALHRRVEMHRPRCLVLAEWDERPPSDGASPERLSSKFGDVASGFDVYVGQRLYPWPDNPANQGKT